MKVEDCGLFFEKYCVERTGRISKYVCNIFNRFARGLCVIVPAGRSKMILAFTHGSGRGNNSSLARKL